MKLETTIIFILISALDDITAHENGNLTIYKGQEKENEEVVNLHSRRKRYIVFPKGSSLQLLLELLVHVPTQFQVLVGPTLQVAWPLPSEISETSQQKKSFVTKNFSVKRHKLVYCNTYLFRPVVDIFRFGMTVGLAWQLPDDPMIFSDFKKKHKIYKRNVFKKMEAFMKPSGTNGRQCVLKALCESGQRTPSKKEFLTEILHKIFSMDVEQEDFEENEEDKLYRKAHQSLNQNCETLYPECQFSIFSLIQ